MEVSSTEVCLRVSAGVCVCMCTKILFIISKKLRGSKFHTTRVKNIYKYNYT